MLPKFKNILVNLNGHFGGTRFIISLASHFASVFLSHISREKSQ